MQCTWPQLARLAFRDVVRPCPPIHLAPRNIQSFLKPSRAPWSTLKLNVNQNLSRKLLHTQTQTSPVLPYHSASLSVFPNTSTQLSPRTPKEQDSNIQENPTPAQTSRTAAQSVRLLVQQNNISGAFLIVKALHSARLEEKSAPPSVQAFLGEIRNIPLVFDDRIPPGLPSHTLLHELIRRDSFAEASELAQMMMEQRIRVRCKTLEAIMLGLQCISHEHDQDGFLSTLFPSNSKNSLHLAPMMSRNTVFTARALSLHLAARKSGQRQSQKMFRYLMTLCIINGEIILASLLFGTLLRDWQKRELKKAETGVPGEELVPMPHEMKTICKNAHWNLTDDEIGEDSQVAFGVSLQALALLAYALDHRMIPFTSDLEVLISTLYRCPRNSEKVWIPGSTSDSKPQQVYAYKYFHAVLYRLIADLPSERRSIAQSVPESGHMLPALSIRQYNALLHYVLHERRSLPQAKKILVHMTRKRHPSLPLDDPTTMNICERALKNFRRGGLSELLDAVCMNQHDSLAELAEMPMRHRHLHSITTRIMSLIASGHPGEVLDALPSLLPGLYNPPVDMTLSFARRQAMKRAYEDKCMQGAVGLGPVVFSSLINAARKVGATSVAENIFLYALEAASNSWNPVDGHTHVKPWCLPVHAYTAMFQVYGNEMRKCRDGSPSRPPSTLYARNWGFTEEGRRLNHKRYRFERHRLARQMIVLTYRLMKASLERTRLSLRDAEYNDIKVYDFQLKPPVADQWLFAALFKIFSHTPTDPIFASLKNEIQEAGLPIPAEYRQLFQKYWPERAEDAMNSGWRKERDMRPFTFPTIDTEGFYGEGAALWTKRLPQQREALSEVERRDWELRLRQSDALSNEKEMDWTSGNRSIPAWTYIGQATHGFKWPEAQLALQP